MITSGTRLGPYEVVSAIGAGGMGEVYRARDTKLHRDVALKILPDHVSSDPDRIARFEREARVLAALNHVNIGHIYGLEDSTSVRALVLELIDGPTLAERIANGAMTIEEALAVAWQIADALAAAHAQGVIHRDLKPANVKLRPDGTAKVLDFGLAKALEPLAASGGAVTATAPMLSPGDTRAGVILGSAAYMSPEQARGEPVDARTDIWSFGVVLFEMLTGTPPFGGRTVTDSLAAILQSEPDLHRVPAPVRPLIDACLQKDPKHRLRDIGDARLLVALTGAAPPSRHRLQWLPWALVAVLVAGGIALAGVAWRRERPVPDVVRFHVTPQGNIPISGGSTISPDGRYLAYLATGSDGVMRVRVRDLRSFDDRLLQGTEIVQAAPPPFWSPDSRHIAYDAGSALMKVDVTGGLPQKICDLAQPAIGGTWNRDGVILIGNTVRGVQRVRENGGTPSTVTVPDVSRMERSHMMPVFLPDGRHFLYLRVSRADASLSGIFIGSLDVSPEQQDLTRLIATPYSVKYAPSVDGTTGYLLVARDGDLYAQAFDERRLRLSGSPVLIVEGVHSYLDGAAVSVSRNGVLVYQAASGESQFGWFDRKGQPLGQVAERGFYSGFSLARDGNRIAAIRVNPQATATAFLWLLDLANRTSTRLTAAGPSSPVLSHDGTRVVFTSYQSGFEGTLVQREIDGAGREDVLIKFNGRMAPTSWARDGRHLLCVTVHPQTNADVWVVALEGTPKASPFLETPAAETQAQFAPTAGPASWVAFTSNESGRDEVYLTTFPKATTRVAVSNGGGHSPQWRADATELFYIGDGGMLTAVPVSDQGVPGQPSPLFRTSSRPGTADATGRRLATPWGMDSEAQRFLFAIPAGGGTSAVFSVVLNWQGALPK